MSLYLSMARQWKLVFGRKRLGKVCGSSVCSDPRKQVNQVDPGPR